MQPVYKYVEIGRKTRRSNETLLTYKSVLRGGELRLLTKVLNTNRLWPLCRSVI